MKFISTSLIDYILSEVTRNVGSTLRFVLPSYPPELLYDIGKQLSEKFLRNKDFKIRFEYGIAFGLGKKWEHGTQREQGFFKKIKKRSWYNFSDNLTSLRHHFKDKNEDCLVVLLAGYEDIRDQASLQDFFHLDQKMLWEVCLDKSFKSWVMDAVHDYVNIEGNEEQLDRVADILADLYRFGLTDPLGISCYLEAKDFSCVLDGRDTLRVILAQLSIFGLPNMIGYEKSRKKSFSSYLEVAQKFMSYGSFIHDKDKRRARKKVELYREEKQEDLTEETLGVYSNTNALLDSLKEYIDTASEHELNKLTKSDFIYIYDNILQHKVRSEKKERTVSLWGQPLEVFLQALWISFGEYKKYSKSPHLVESILSVSLTSLHFKHQYDKDEKETALLFLQKALGGIDKYISDHIQIRNSGENTIQVSSNLVPKEMEDISYSSAHQAIPVLEFKTTITDAEGNPSEKKFKWALGKNCQTRFLVNLFDWAFNNYRRFTVLPTFIAQYLNEMFMVKDEEDVIRILNIALEKQSGSIKDLLDAPNVDKNDPLTDILYELSTHYQKFLSAYTTSGFFSALNNEFALVRKAYLKALNEYLNDNSLTALGPLLMKAFMIISDKYTSEKTNWEWKESLDCGVVTPLHPALLEMIQHQHVYLCTSFCTYVLKGLNEVGNKGLSEANWFRLVDLAQIKWPILGLLGDNNILDTNVKSYDYIHLVGKASNDYSTISSRLLVKYEDGDDDEDVTDVELFRETQEGKLIKQVLLDYRSLHPYASDGLSIGIYCGGAFQQIIGGIDTYLTEVAGNSEGLYSLKLTIYSDSPDDSSILAWIEAWKERWHKNEGQSSRKHYASSNISVYYQVVQDREQLNNHIKQTDQDLMIFTDFSRPLHSKFRPLGDKCPCGYSDYLKFPILEKANCAVIDGGKIKERELILSNKRFIFGAKHAEVMARIQNYHGANSNQHVVISTTGFSPWEGVIDAAHKNCVWVLCIDPIVDEKLIYNNGVEREIVGFGTGVGPHGEYNFTVSTEQFLLSDVVVKITDQLEGILADNDRTTLKKVAGNLIREASAISGLSVVKATGPSEYVRDYISYALVRRLLPQDNDTFCDEIISLDAFMHWFDFGPANMRPDLLRLQTKIEDNSFKIKAQIIECKLAKQSEGYMEKALLQIEEGLRQLIPRFRPRQSATPVGIEEQSGESLPPDQRYWWMQLHRLVSSCGEIGMAQYDETLWALEGLSDGCYDIEWEAAAIAFWTDIPNEKIIKTPQWSFNIDNRNMTICSVECGKNFITQVGLNSTNINLFGGPSICYSHVKAPTIYKPNEEDICSEKFTNLSDTCSYVKNENTNAVLTPENGIDVPKRIQLGQGTAGGREINWEYGHEDLPNRHLLIFGASGTGKTYTIQAVMAELSKRNINSLIVDYTSGFTTQQLEPIIVSRLSPKQHVIRKQPLKINPFRKQSYSLDGESFEDKPVQVAQRASGVFSEVYRLGEQQKSVLYNVIKTGIEEAGNGFNLDMLADRLENMQEQGGIVANSATTVLNKIRPFVDMDPFGHEDPQGWDKIFLDPNSKCHVLQLAGFMKDAARLITEFSLIDLYWYYRAKGSKDRPRVIILDEIQNLDHSLESPLGQFLTEGRKFGISLILATQTLSNLNREERDRLFQASHKLFFKPADTEIKFFAQLLADATNEKLDTWVQRLSVLKRGECYSLGNAYNPNTDKLEVNRAFKIKINALENRF